MILQTRPASRSSVGDVLLDQVQMMERYGFDSLDVTDPVTERLLRERGVAKGTRPWARSLV